MNEPSPLASYSGQARLFPLPNLVFFPHVMQPLHIFEPRYRQMTTDALEGDRLIALVAPKPGWEKGYAGKPAIEKVGCIGHIVAEQRLEDGRFNILLRGQARVRIVEEIACNKLYRLARTEILYEQSVANPATAKRWRKMLLASTAEWFAEQKQVVEQLHKLIHSDLPLGPLCDIIAFASPLDAEFKQVLLEELSVEARLEKLRAELDARHVPSRPFPPEFSLN